MVSNRVDYTVLILTLVTFISCKWGIEDQDIQSEGNTIFELLNPKLSNFSITDQYSESINFYDVKFNSKYLFVFYFSKYNCNDCVENYFKIIDSLGAKIGHDNIAIISHFEGVKMLNVYKKTRNIKCRIYNTKDTIKHLAFSKPIDEYPRMFLVHKDFNLSQPHLGTIRDSIDSPYFNEIYDRFIRKN